MKIETTPREDHQVTLVVELEAERMERARRAAARKLSKKVKIPGFRPGKAPYEVIRLHIGEEAIIEEAIDALLDDIYPKAIEEAGIQPGAPGRLDEVASIDPPKFVFTVPLKPSVDLGDYRKVRVPYEWEAPTEKEVDAALEEIRRSYGITQPVERPIEAGDFVQLEIVGKKTKVEEGEDPIVLDTKTLAIVAASKNETSVEPYPGFSKKLVGLSVGDEKTFSHKFPEDYEDESLRGATVKYTVKIKAVHAVELPPLDDDLAKTVGVGETLEDLRKAVRENLETKSREEYDNAYYEEVIGKMISLAKFSYAPVTLEEEIETIFAQTESQLTQYGLTMENYLEMEGKTREAFIEETVKPAAEKRLKERLFLDAVFLEEDVEVNGADFQKEFGRLLLDLEEMGIDASRIRARRDRERIADILATESMNNIALYAVLERIKAIASGELEKAEAEAAKAAKEKEEEEKEPETEDSLETTPETEDSPETTPETETKDE